jgi:Tfp pilus assembly protein PilO
MKSANRMIIAMLVVTALAIGFWVVLLSPKREKAAELSGQIDSLNVSLAEAQSREAEALAAKQDFPADYRQLVVLGQAVPASDETSSLLVEIQQVATESKLRFESIQLSGSGEGSAAAVAPAPVAPAEPSATESGAVPAAATVPPTEAAASLLPLGATVGPAGLAVMPYSLTFTGDFFQIADFIKGIDSLVDTHNAGVGVDGRLVTLNGFALSPDPARKFPHLSVTFSVTTYLIPPGELTAGASPIEPAPATETAEEPTESSEATAAQ